MDMITIMDMLTITAPISMPIRHRKRIP
jgi:hypothetical protein